MAEQKNLEYRELLANRSKAEETINKIVKKIEEKFGCSVDLEVHKLNRKSGERFPKTKHVQIKINI